MQVSNVKGGSRQSRRQDIRRKTHFQLGTLSVDALKGGHCLWIAAEVPDAVKGLFDAIISNKTCVFGVVYINKLIVEYSAPLKLETLNLMCFNSTTGLQCSRSDTSPLLLDILFPVKSLCLAEASCFCFAGNSSQCVSLLSFAILHRRDVIISSLLRSCVNPFTFNIDLEQPTSSSESNRLVSSPVHQCVADYKAKTPLTAFIWLLYQIDQLKSADLIGLSCSMCDLHCHQAHSFLSMKACGHSVCLSCLWKNIDAFTGVESCQGEQFLDYLSYDVNALLKDCLYCPVCRSAVTSTVASTTAFTLVDDDAEVNKKKSLEKWWILPDPAMNDCMQSNNNARISGGNSSSFEKLKFRALSPSQSAYYSLGTSRNQRTNLLFNCVVENNPRKLLALIDKGVCIDLVNHYHMTALCVAVMLGHCEVTIVLLKAGADVFINNAVEGCSIGTSHSGCFLLDIARHYKHIRVERILMQYLQMHYADRLVKCQVSRTLTSPSELIDVNEHTAIRWLVPCNSMVTCVKGSKEIHKPHPGAGRSFFIDHIFTSEFIDHITHRFSGLPVAQKVKESCSDRSYYCDVMGQLTSTIQMAVELMLRRTRESNDDNANSDFCAFKSVEVFPSMKLLNYTQTGGTSSPHIDLNKSSVLTQHHSTYTFILYTGDCDLGGQTVLLRSVKETWSVETNQPVSENVLACVAPRRGRLLVFPHNCPHAGLATIDIPKTLLRGEILIE